MAYVMDRVDDGGIITMYSETLEDAEYIASIEERWNYESAIINCRYFISDFTPVTKVNITTDALRKSAEISIEAAKLNNHIVGIAVLPTDLEYGLARMWQVYAETIGWKTYRPKV